MTEPSINPTSTKTANGTDGLYDVPSDPETWDLLVQASGLMSSSEIMTFLKTATHKGIHAHHLPYWSGYLDELVMYAYQDDPAPFDAGWKDLPTHAMKGIAFVMARFGKDVGSVLKDKITYPKRN